VAPIYAGILGPLAFLTALIRGLMHGSGAESVLWTAWCGLLVFAAVGYVIGWIGQRTVEDAISSRIAAELSARRAAQKAGPAAD